MSSIIFVIFFIFSLASLTSLILFVVSSIISPAFSIEFFDSVIMLLPIIALSVEDFIVEAISSIELAVSCKLAA